MKSGPRWLNRRYQHRKYASRHEIHLPRGVAWRTGKVKSQRRCVLKKTEQKKKKKRQSRQAIRLIKRELNIKAKLTAMAGIF